jgi:hypothetical protein
MGRDRKATLLDLLMILSARETLLTLNLVHSLNNMPNESYGQRRADSLVSCFQFRETNSAIWLFLLGPRRLLIACNAISHGAP